MKSCACDGERANSMKYQIICTIDHTLSRECFSDHSNAFGFSKSEHHRCAVSESIFLTREEDER